MNKLIVDASLNQYRVALLEDDDLVEVYFETNEDSSIVGNIYKGKVENVLKGMQAAFVNIGLEKNAFLYVKDALPNYIDKDVSEQPIPSIKEDLSIEDIVKKGQDIIVQVIKEAIGTKGPRVTTQVTLPGKYLVLMPTTNYVGVSRRIEKEAERERLRSLINGIKPESMGVIIRTACQDKTSEELKQDLDYLTDLWASINKRIIGVNAPGTLHKDFNLVDRTIRDLLSTEVDRLEISNKEEYTKILRLVEDTYPHLKSKIKYFDKDMDIFDHYDIDSKLSKALSKKVWLKSGGYIIIDETEALTVIDVNTGKFVGSYDLEDTVLRTNIEAAYEIAKQIRLRDISGIIIIDFIDMNTPHNNNIILESLKNALKKDRTKTTVLGMTQLGLVEMTRKKVRQKLSSVVQQECHMCYGSGRVLANNLLAKKIERQLIRLLNHVTTKNILIEVSRDYFGYISQKSNLDLDYYNTKFSRMINISISESLSGSQFNIVPKP